jgi:hypothetical protein
MTRKHPSNNKTTKDEMLVDISFKAKVSPKLRELISTTTEAGKTVVKVGQRLLPILIILGAIASSCVPMHPELSTPPESTQKTQK